MDKSKLCEKLGVQQGGMFHVQHLHVGGWGNGLVLDCLYEPPESGAASVPFQIKLDDCRDIQWRVYAHLRHPEDQTLPTATVVNVRLGTGGHRKPLHLLTDFFGLTVNYGTMDITNGTVEGTSL
jgi:hypothetical protein